MRIAECRVRNDDRNRMQKMDCEISPPHSALLTPNSKGFTLIEIVITIVLVSILSGIAAMIILQGVRAYSTEQTRSDVHYQARIAMERMAREIRAIRSTDPADITASTATNLQFTDVNGSTLGFQLIGPILNRWNGASNDVLASGVAAFSFSYFRDDGVTAAVLPADLSLLWFIDIAMTSQQGPETLQMRTRVHPRNF